MATRLLIPLPGVAAAAVLAALLSQGSRAPRSAELARSNRAAAKSVEISARVVERSALGPLPSLLCLRPSRESERGGRSRSRRLRRSRRAASSRGVLA